MPEAAKVDAEAEKSRIIEYHGLITDVKGRILCGMRFRGAVVAYKKKAALPDGAFAGGHNARVRKCGDGLRTQAAPSAA